ncbi:Rho-GTPase-activating protein 8 [Dispira simplex]|nr:Rho-GTPase-activating protein 8 [Dispira simplex]
MFKFENCFWSNLDTGPDYRPGVEPLELKLEQGIVELDEVLVFFTERIAIERSYAQHLRALGERAGRSQGFLRDDGASLRMVFEAIRREHLAKSQSHYRFVQDMLDRVIAPLTAFRDLHAQRLGANREALSSEFNKYAFVRRRAEQLGRTYRAQCARADWAQAATERNLASTYVEHQDIRVVSHVVGKLSFTRGDFIRFLDRLQTTLPTQSVKFGILGTFHGLVQGDELAQWLLAHYPNQLVHLQDAEAVGQSLVGQSYLRHMGRGNTFAAQSDSYYQWRSAARDLVQRPDFEATLSPNFDRGRSPAMASHMTATRSLVNIVGGSLMASTSDEWGSTDADDIPLGYSRRRRSGDSFEYDDDSLEVTHERMRAKAELTNVQYLTAVRKADHVRTTLEEQLFNYLETLHEWETDRLLNIQSALGHFAHALNPLANRESREYYDRVVASCESFKPDQDLQFTIEHYGTGSFCPRPVVYNHHYLGTAEFQVFGVSLEDQWKLSPKSAPLFVSKALSAIHKSTAGLIPEAQRTVWLSQPNLSPIHALRYEVNHSSGVTLKQLRLFSPEIIVGALRLYLLELPDCLCTFELYDAVKALYNSRKKAMDPQALITCISNLLSGLPPANLITLRALLEPLHQLGTDSDANFYQQLGVQFGPVILRNRRESNVNFHDRHPAKFFQDLVTHINAIFQRVKLRAHHKSEGQTTLTNRPGDMPHQRHETLRRRRVETTPYPPSVGRDQDTLDAGLVTSANLPSLLSPTLAIRSTADSHRPVPMHRLATAPPCTGQPSTSHQASKSTTASLYPRRSHSTLVYDVQERFDSAASSPVSSMSEDLHKLTHELTQLLHDPQSDLGGDKEIGSSDQPQAAAESPECVSIVSQHESLAAEGSSSVSDPADKHLDQETPIVPNLVENDSPQTPPTVVDLSIPANTITTKNAGIALRETSESDDDLHPFFKD